jgi:hypothetical protein
VNATVDCTNYVTQLLRRLARRDYNTQIQPDEPGIGDYPIDHSDALHWDTDRTEEVHHLEDYEWNLMEKGDLVTRDVIYHVMVYVRLVDDGIPDDFVGPIPADYYGYQYEVWESTTDGQARVRLFTRTGDQRTHFRQWLDDVVFNNCD